MVRTQIQLPDELYRKARALAEAQEWSLAETVRRSLEMFIPTYPRATEPRDEPWRMPEPHDFGKMKVDESQWQEFANLEHVMEQLSRDREL